MFDGGRLSTKARKASIVLMSMTVCPYAFFMICSLRLLLGGVFDHHETSIYAETA